jgi:hypothetical protein
MRESRPDFGWEPSRNAHRAVIAVLLFVICGTAAVIAGELMAWKKEPPPPPSQHLFLSERQVGIRLPPAVPAASAGLAEGEVVVGVSAGGRHRAYRLAALAPIRGHVVNDVLAGRPVTVTYCDRVECVRVFTGPPGPPLDVAGAGWDNREGRRGLVLRVGSTLYRQDTGGPAEDAPVPPFPHAAAEYERTTWGRWRQAHPDTDAYVGDPSPAPEGGAASGNGPE